MAGEISIAGLTGGFDYNSLLQQIQQIKSQQIYMLQLRQQQIGSKKSAITDIQGILTNIKNAVSKLNDDSILNGKSINSSDQTILSPILTDQSKAQTGLYTIAVNRLAQNTVIASSLGVTDKDNPLGANNGILTIRYKGLDYNVAYDSTYSLQNIADEINKTSQTYNGAFRASIVNVGGSSSPNYKLVISGTNTGSDEAVSVIGDSGGLSSIIGGFNELKSAQNAQINLNGLEIERPTNTFNDVLEGISFNVYRTGTINLTVDRNDDPLKSAIGEFVNQYNVLVDKLSTQTGKDGVLSGEYSLNQIKNSVFKEVQDLLYSDILNFDRTTGKLSLNTSRLEEVLNSSSNQSSSLIQTRQQLIDKLTQMSSNLNVYILQTTSSTGTLGNMISSYDKQISSMQKSIDAMTQRVQIEIDILKQQFIYMESLQAQYNSISARIQATFGLNNTNK